MLTSESKESSLKEHMFDTLGIYRRLKQARATEAVSREIAAILGEVVQGQLATKQDVRDLKLEIATTRNDTLRWMMGMMVAQSALLVSVMKFL